MIKFLINPFKTIAGLRALMAGLTIMILTVLVGWAGNIHFPDVISLKTSADLPFQYLLIQTISNWIVFSLLLYIYAIIFSKSSIRAIDIFGTQALARFPYLPGAFIGFSDSIEKFGKFILSKTIQPGLTISVSPMEIAIAFILLFFSLIMLIWMVALMYKAFSISANLNGPKGIVGFIVILILSIVVTATISFKLFETGLFG